MNRIHKQFVVGIRKPERNIPYKNPVIPINNVSNNTHNNIDTHPNINNINYDNYDNIMQYIKTNMNRSHNIEEKEILENLEEFKSKIEYDIYTLKQKVETLNLNNNVNNVEDINYALQLIENLTKQIEDYKQITNERIEKLIKLFLMINSQIANLKKG